MTLVTGLVDAFSYLALGHVLVANMTGNVVFLGFALAGEPGFSIAASLAALASFVLGAFVGGAAGSRVGHHRGHVLSVAAAMQAGLLAISVVLAALSGSPASSGFRDSLIVVLGIAMGIQNASVRRLAVPDLTTTVLTLTITGIAADSAAVGGKGSHFGRRLIAVTAMLAGALLGAALIVHVDLVYPLVIAVVVTAVVAAAAQVLGSADPPWSEHRQLARRAPDPDDAGSSLRRRVHAVRPRCSSGFGPRPARPPFTVGVKGTLTNSLDIVEEGELAENWDTRLDGGNISPSLPTLDRIAKALGGEVSLSIVDRAEQSGRSSRHLALPY